MSLWRKSRFLILKYVCRSESKTLSENCDILSHLHLLKTYLKNRSNQQDETFDQVQFSDGRNIKWANLYCPQNVMDTHYRKISMAFSSQARVELKPKLAGHNNNLNLFFKLLIRCQGIEFAADRQNSNGCSLASFEQ